MTQLMDFSNPGKICRICGHHKSMVVVPYHYGYQYQGKIFHLNQHFTCTNTEIYAK